MGRSFFSAEFSTDAGGLAGLDSFIRCCASKASLPDSLGSSLLITAIECFENISEHSFSGIDAGNTVSEGFPIRCFSVTVLLTIAPGKPFCLAFCYRPEGKAGAFRFRKKNMENLRKITAKAGEAPPVYDEKTRRWRNLGLKLCKNLTKGIEYRCGLFRNKISFYFKNSGK